MFTKKEGDDTFPYFLAANKWREPMGVAQMTHVSLYADRFMRSTDR